MDAKVSVEIMSKTDIPVERDRLANKTIEVLVTLEDGTVLNMRNMLNEAITANGTEVENTHDLAKKFEMGFKLLEVETQRHMLFTP